MDLNKIRKGNILYPITITGKISEEDYKFIKNNKISTGSLIRLAISELKDKQIKQDDKGETDQIV